LRKFTSRNILQNAVISFLLGSQNSMHKLLRRAFDYTEQTLSAPTKKQET